MLVKLTKNLALTRQILIAIVCCLLIFHKLHVQGLSIDKSSSKDQLIEQAATNGKQDVPKQMITSSSSSSMHMLDLRRPIWNLAHMVNSIKELDYRLEKGANAVEADVTFSRNGDPLFTYHGPPCDCWRHCHQQENFNEYLTYVREITIDNDSPDGGIGKNLTLLFLDLKLDYLDHKGKERAGQELAKSIIENLFLDLIDANLSIEKKQKLRLIISVNHVGDIQLVNNFLHYLDANNLSHLMERIGFDVGMNDDLQQIESMWRKFGSNNNNQLNLWQGDGYTNCISPFYNLERLTKALQKRNNFQGYPRKVYQWTIDLHDRIRESLMLGVDAVMTNHPERLLTVLKEPDMAHNFRLATRADNPFEKIISRASSRSSESARYQRSASPTSGGFFGSLLDVFSSWFAYIKEIPFLSLPTTSRLLPRVKRHRQKTVNNSSSSVSGYSGQIYSTTNNKQQKQNSSASSNIGQKSELRVTDHGVNVVKKGLNASNSTMLLGANLTLASNNIQNRNAEERSSSTTLSEQATQTTLATGESGEQQVSTTITTTTTTTTTTAADANLENIQQQQPPYEGPKWYTSLVSNVLVSMMKIALPAQ